jgi:membrane protein implicated in regulation of membrane protease activity
MLVSAVLGADVAGYGVTATARGHVLDYGVGDSIGWWLIGGYLVATLGAPLLSPDRFVRWFGVAALVGAVACAAAWIFAFASTWCAYAAVLSVILLIWVRRREPAEVLERVDVYAG